MRISHLVLGVILVWNWWTFEDVHIIIWDHFWCYFDITDTLKTRGLSSLIDYSQSWNCVVYVTTELGEPFTVTRIYHKKLTAVYVWIPFMIRNLIAHTLKCRQWIKVSHNVMYGLFSATAVNCDEQHFIEYSWVVKSRSASYYPRTICIQHCGCCSIWMLSIISTRQFTFHSEEYTLGLHI